MSLFTDLKEVLTSYASRIKNLDNQISEVNESLGDLVDLSTVDKTSVVAAINEVVSDGLSYEARVALLNCFRNVVWINDLGQTYYDALEFNLLASRNDYTWLYRPSVDGLLSQNENVSAVTAIGGQAYATETLDGDILNLSAEYDGTNHGSIFKPLPLTSTSAVLRAKVKFNALPISSPGGGLRMQVSNGTSGAQLFVYRDAANPNQPRISTFSSTTGMRLADITLNKWYILTCELSGNAQIIKVDDVTYNIPALSTYANTETRLIALEPDNTVSSAPGDLSFDIAWVAFKDNSN